jgi:hypothetical protein
MQHAFTWLPLPYRWILLALLCAGAAVFVIMLTAQGKPLRTSAAPHGMLAYEFAWHRARAEQILDSWSSLKDTAQQQLRLDFGFLLLYPILLSLACAMLAESSLNSMAIVGCFVSWAMLAAGPLDAVENFALLRMLDLGASGCLARLAGWCAGVKFLLVYAGLGYIERVAKLILNKFNRLYVFQV